MVGSQGRALSSVAVLRSCIYSFRVKEQLLVIRGALIEIACDPREGDGGDRPAKFGCDIQSSPGLLTLCNLLIGQALPGGAASAIHAEQWGVERRPQLR